jgi:hypothetical protein
MVTVRETRGSTVGDVGYYLLGVLSVLVSAGLLLLVGWLVERRRTTRRPWRG